MKGKFLKKLICAVLSVALVIVCVPSVFAVLSPIEEEAVNTPGGLFVGTQGIVPDTEYIEELLEGFEVKEVKLLSTNFGNEDGIYCCADVEEALDTTLCKYRVDLVNETAELLQKAADVLSENPYIYTAFPNKVLKADVPTEAPTEPSEPEATADEPTVPEITEAIPMPEPEPTCIIETTQATEPQETVIICSLPTAPVIEYTEAVTYPAATEEATEAPEVTTAPEAREDAGEYLPVETDVKGDANSDGKLTVKDATVIQKYLAGLISAEEINLTAAAIKIEGKVSVRDATMIQKKVAGISCEW